MRKLRKDDLRIDLRVQHLGSYHYGTIVEIYEHYGCRWDIKWDTGGTSKGFNYKDYPYLRVLTKLEQVLE